MTNFVPTTVEEQILLGIVPHLRPERVSEVIDFARFLHYQVERARDYVSPDERQAASKLAEGGARWDALLAIEESQRLLEQMADEAAAEIEAGLARPIVFTEGDEIAS